MSCALLFRLLFCYVVPAQWARGIVFGGDAWTIYNTEYGTDPSTQSLTELANTGATHVRLLITAYQDSENSTSIYPLAAPSPLATTSLTALAQTILLAQKLGLEVVLTPLVEINWDLVWNGRDLDHPSYPNNVTRQSRARITLAMSDEEWSIWFANYSFWILSLADFASLHNVSWFSVASGLDSAITSHASNWTSLCAQLRGHFTGQLFLQASFSIAAQIQWWDKLDMIGVSLYVPLGTNLSLGASPSVSDLVEAWQPYVMNLTKLHQQYPSLPLVISELGFQSRPSCHVRPQATWSRNPSDDSPWIQTHDMTCQANAYEAFFEAFVGIPFSSSSPSHSSSPVLPFLKGVFWWIWRGDPTSGGTSDYDFTPRAKPAASVLQKWYGGKAPYSGDKEDEKMYPGSLAIEKALREVKFKLGKADQIEPKMRREWQGFVLGSDLWSSPYYYMDAEGTQRSVESMIAQTGADSVEIVVEWYTDSINSTDIYPLWVPSAPLRTSSDQELSVFVAFAQSKNLKIVVSPMLDLNYWGTNCDSNCGWRGQFGQSWNASNCSAGSEWGQWWGNYGPMIVRYAIWAQRWNASAYLIQHELYSAARACSDNWKNLIKEVRAVYSGQISAAFFGDILTPEIQALTPYVTQLDWLGIDCYSGGGPLPLTVFGNTSYPHPLLPWQDYDRQTLLTAKQALLPQYAAAAKWSGKKIVCTEVGWRSNPWSWASYSGSPGLDPADGSVVSQNANLMAQVRAYQAFLDAFYDISNDWFAGVLFWLWRSDPTAGGLSDDGFGVSGKPAAAIIQQAWAT